ncbi:MAG: MarR family transcriptional regulator [Bacteroidota bacterium]
MQQMDFDNTLGRYIGQLNTALSMALNQELQRAKVDVTSEQFRLLTHLWKEDGLSQIILAERTGRDRGSITRMLDILENKGFTVRVADKNDRRINNIYLTKKGQSIQSSAVSCAQVVLSKITEGFSESERKELHQLLKKASENFER